MKYKLKEDHQVRLSDKILKAGIYTLEELEKAHQHDSLAFCLNYTKLKDKLEFFEEEKESKPIPVKTKKKK